LNIESWSTLWSYTLLATCIGKYITVEVICVCYSGNYIVRISCHSFSAWFSCILNSCCGWVSWARCCCVSASHNSISLLIICLYNLLHWVRSASSKVISHIAIWCVSPVQAQVIKPVDAISCRWLSPVEKEVCVGRVPTCEVAIQIITIKVKDCRRWISWSASTN
jgi:hypothetical protein